MGPRAARPPSLLSASALQVSLACASSPLRRPQDQDHVEQPHRAGARRPRRVELAARQAHHRACVLFLLGSLPLSLAKLTCAKRTLSTQIAGDKGEPTVQATSRSLDPAEPDPAARSRRKPSPSRPVGRASSDLEHAQEPLECVPRLLPDHVPDQTLTIAFSFAPQGRDMGTGTCSAWSSTCTSSTRLRRQASPLRARRRGSAGATTAFSLQAGSPSLCVPSSFSLALDRPRL